jgi:hypothetical protein
VHCGIKSAVAREDGRFVYHYLLSCLFTFPVSSTSKSIIMPIQLRPPPGTPGAAWPAICVGLFVAFGGVLFGYDTGTIGGILAMPYWLKTFSTGYTVDGLPAITSSQSSQIVSILVSYSKKQ